MHVAGGVSPDMEALLNQLFPSDLSKLSEASSYNEEVIKSLKTEISTRKHSGEPVAPDLEMSLKELQEETRKIQTLGVETLNKVHDVTKDIKTLDTTKENLVSSVKLLRQLKMLTKLYLQLDILLKEKRYEDMSHIVRAASDLTNYFRPFRPLPQISKLSQEIGDMESKIYHQIEEDFKLAINGNGQSDMCISACHVLDTLDTALGQPINQKRLIKFYSDETLSEYKKIFNYKDEAGLLENVGRRFTYLKNKVILRYISQHASLFPQEWHVKTALLEEIGEQTSNDLLKQLNNLSATNSDQIQMLLTAIYESMEFENYVKVPNLITPKLLPSLSLWVDFQNQQITQRVVGYSRQISPLQPTDEVVPSSRELINLYRALLTQLSQIRRPSSNLIAQLSEVLALHLGKYAQRVLMSYLPEVISNRDELRTIRTINATSDYILSTTTQLQRSLCGMMNNDEEAAEKIDDVFEHSALTLYRQVGIKCENLLAVYIQRSLDPMWVEMAVQYKNGDIDVSRVSVYTQQLISSLKVLLEETTGEMSPMPAPSPTFIYNIYSKTADFVCSGFLTMAMARVPKPISGAIVEQMLLDLGEVKSQALMQSLMEIPPEIKNGSGGSKLERLSAKILERVGQAEAVLKVLHTPAEPMETFIRNYQVLVKDRSTLNFRKILDVKGVRFQPKAMEKFKLMASQDPSLISENAMLRNIPTIPPQIEMNNQGFGFKRIGDFLRREL